MTPALRERLAAFERTALQPLLDAGSLAKRPASLTGGARNMARTAAMASPCLAGGKGAKVPRRRVVTLAKKCKCQQVPDTQITGTVSIRGPINQRDQVYACMGKMSQGPEDPVGFSSFLPAKPHVGS